MDLKFSVINKSGSKILSDGKPYPVSEKWWKESPPDQNIQSGEQFISGIKGFSTGEIAGLGYTNGITVSVKLLSSGNLEATISGSRNSTFAISGSMVTFTIK